MKIKSHYWFYSIQTISWGLFALINILFKMAKSPVLNKTYIVVEGLIFFGSAFLASSLLRYYIKRNQLFDSTKNKVFIKILLALIITSISLALIGVLLAYFTYGLFHKEDITISNTLILVTIVNTFLYLFLWLMCYRIIKMTQGFRKNKEERLKLENNLKESELNTLKGQINPHFMFNSLNNIRGLMLEDVSKSREMITCLSEMLRYSLTQNKVDFIPLQEELEMVSNFIQLSKIQFEDRLIYTQNIGSNLLNINIPPMMLQMLVENAIKHGISNLVEGGKIHLEVSTLQKHLELKVTNTGTIKTNATSTKVGLDNIKKRLYLLYKNEANFNLKEENNTVIATIKLPL